MPDSTWFLTLRIAIQSPMPFLQKRASLNSTHIMEGDERGTGRFCNISGVSVSQHQSSRFGNKCSEKSSHQHVDHLSFCRTSVAFSPSFSTIIFLSEYFSLG